jgi:CBS domain-containing protein
VTPETATVGAARLMLRDRISGLPVVDDGRLVGIVSRADLVRALVDRTEQPASCGTSDEEIRERILAAIAAEPWGPRCDVSVWVKHGVVDLGGTYTDEDERAALKVLAESMPGVKEVRDRLVRIEPAFGTVLPPESSPPTIG